MLQVLIRRRLHPFSLSLFSLKCSNPSHPIYLNINGLENRKLYAGKCSHWLLLCILMMHLALFFNKAHGICSNRESWRSKAHNLLIYSRIIWLLDALFRTTLQHDFSWMFLVMTSCLWKCLQSIVSYKGSMPTLYIYIYILFFFFYSFFWVDVLDYVVSKGTNFSSLLILIHSMVM